MNGQQVRPTTGSMWACIETTLLLHNISYVCLLNSNWILQIVTTILMFDAEMSDNQFVYIDDGLTCSSRNDVTDLQDHERMR